jgi:flagellar biosynthesis anti-sigma factor FlgM
MRINDISKTTLIQNYGKTSGTQAPHPAQMGQDKLVLSAEARGFMDALKAAREADPVNTQKVDEVSDKIRRGTYVVSGRQVADKIVDKG